MLLMIVFSSIFFLNILSTKRLRYSLLIFGAVITIASFFLTGKSAAVSAAAIFLRMSSLLAIIFVLLFHNNIYVLARKSRGSCSTGPFFVHLTLLWQACLFPTFCLTLLLAPYFPLFSYPSP